MSGKASVWILAGVLLSAMPLAEAVTPQEDLMIENAAQRDSTSAQVLLAFAYLNGEGGHEKDPKMAAHWFEMAAEGGNAYAQAKLADLYAEGLGVPLNLKVAADWREKAANRGNVGAEVKLGKMYLVGEGVDTNLDKAHEWLSRAAVEGNSEAQYLLGKMYHEGNGVPKNPQIAGNWLAKSAAHSYEDAVKLLHLIEGFGFHVEAGLYQRLPQLTKLAEDGDAEAAYQLAVRYETGAHGLERDPAKALMWFRKAAEGGNVMAMKSLAHIYREGLDGVAKDPVEAASWEKKAQAAK